MRRRDMKKERHQQAAWGAADEARWHGPRREAIFASLQNAKDYLRRQREGGIIIRLTHHGHQPPYEYLVAIGDNASRYPFSCICRKEPGNGTLTQAGQEDDRQ